MNQIQQKQYTGKGGIHQQLTLPISEIILIDEHESVYIANAQLKELDYRKLYQVCSPRGRKPAAETRIMFKLLVYEQHGQNCFIKPISYEKQKTKKLKSQFWRVENMEHWNTRMAFFAQGEKAFPCSFQLQKGKWLCHDHELLKPCLCSIILAGSCCSPKLTKKR